MPNKLFEYILAGLAVAISPAPDMREIVEHYGLGVISTHTSPQAIADTMNSLTLDSVTAFKTKARAAATELCWETEKEKLRAVIENLLITAAGRDEHTTDAGIG